ncbi:macrolide family glycosyltransferase [Paenibacillus xerothermodurans]|uniref:UDP-glucosyltransferase n=1 Tax=Paenibacillus xerothermodurans TaxID=1977292 RepID=A0A2W1NX63_PAEXE|nr:macrolide family glycosyltransferase [Paenibacillus xerothermodurans]PZE20252.1 UDP-glucosyltransferase [Paenibacillus xerothermodurans]
MANVLIVNFPAAGHVNPTLGMVKAFTERGDQVHYITTDKFKERIEGVGATVHLQPDLLSSAAIKPDAPEGLSALLNIFIQTSIDTLSVVQKLAESYKFDFVFYDTFGAGELVRDYLEVPGIVSSASFLIPPDMLTMLPLHPDSGVEIALNEQASAGLRQTKEQFGVTPKNIAQFMHNTGELTVVYTSRYFQPQSEKFDDSHLFIGPSFPDRKDAQGFPLAELHNQKVIYISMGTVLGDVEDFFNTCVDAFAHFDGKVVIAAGDRADFTKIKTAPSNFIISHYVPQLEVLDKTDVFITHGGMNSVNEAIHFNVPLVVIPHDKDQPMVAQRLVELNAAYRLDKSSVNAQALRTAVDKVLSDQTYRKGIEQINHSFQECIGPRRAVEEINEFLEKKRMR